MKLIFTLLTGLVICVTAQSQVVLNEIYAIPNAGKHEFFELYNNGASISPIPLDNYTVVTYFEEADGDVGFYVLDMPNISIAPKGYVVASAANPFNYQGVNASTATSFSWNDLAYMAANNGYLKKWVKKSLVPAIIDGNANYDEEPIPADFNDFFYKRGGVGASYTVFVYSNGILVNGFFGGVSQNATPPFILAMPKLEVNMTGAAVDFPIDFPNYGSIRAEYVIPDAGSDNGYTRIRDGLCGSWEKSSAQIQHSPLQPNGTDAGTIGTITVSASITLGANTNDSSVVTYKIMDAPAEAYPIVLDVYIDNGSASHDLDANDYHLATKTITTSGGPAFQTKFLPVNATILIGLRTAAGCFDKVMILGSEYVILASNIVDLTGSIDNNGKAKLQWRTSQNELINQFEVEKSIDGKTFETIGMVFTSEKTGLETYQFKYDDSKALNNYYRIKAISKSGKSTYSKVIRLISENISRDGLSILKNPVDAYLTFSYQSSEDSNSEVSIYNIAGVKVYTTNVRSNKGANAITLNMGGRIYSGMYLLELKNGADKKAVKFLKN